MDKSEAMQLLNEICAACPEVAMGGFYIKDIRSSPQGRVELRLLSQLNRDSNKNLNSILTRRGLKLIKTNDLLIIY